ncbi:MAG: hypothetical protein O7F12_15970 [Nitrospirae bacterium]|nr:hypothetical protein [Nitrospirota bacterium]
MAIRQAANLHSSWWNNSAIADYKWLPSWSSKSDYYQQAYRGMARA